MGLKKWDNKCVKGTVLCHTSRIYIYLIESPPAIKRIGLF